jgi:hypothetical protein
MDLQDAEQLGGLGGGKKLVDLHLKLSCNKSKVCTAPIGYNQLEETQHRSQPSI